MPFLPYNLRALYPFAHQIVVVEGAAPGAAGIAAPDGHSRDGTLEELRRFAARGGSGGQARGGHGGGRRPPGRLLARREGRAEPRVRGPRHRRLPVAGGRRRVLPALAHGAGPRGPGGGSFDHRRHLSHAHLLGLAGLRRGRLVPAARRRPTTTGCSGGGRATATRRTGRRRSCDASGRDTRAVRWLDAAETGPPRASPCTTTRCCFRGRRGRRWSTTPTGASYGDFVRRGARSPLAGGLLPHAAPSLPGPQRLPVPQLAGALLGATSATRCCA